MSDLGPRLEREMQEVRPAGYTLADVARRRDRRRRSQRIGAATVALGFSVAAGLGLLQAFGRITSNDPAEPGPPASPVVVTFTFNLPDSPATMLIDGTRVEGDMVNAPENSGVFYEFTPDRTAAVPAGAPVLVEHNAVGVRGWVDACCDLSKPPVRLHELDLANAASLPGDPGTYFLEFAVRWPRSEGGVLTFLFPVRVVSPETA